MTANIASAVVYGAAGPAPAPTRGVRRSERVQHVGNEAERATLLSTPEPEHPAAPATPPNTRQSTANYIPAFGRSYY